MTSLNTDSSLDRVFGGGIMQLVRIFVAIIALGPSVVPAIAFSQKDDIDCSQASDMNLKFEACTRLLRIGNLTKENRSIFYGNRGNARLAKGELDSALADFDESIRLNPKYGAAHNGRGNVWEKKKDFDRAIGDYNEAIRLLPKNAVPYNGRGNAWSGQSNFDRAIADFDEAIRLNPTYSFAYNGRGNAYRSKGEPDRALADYNEAIRLNPNWSFPYNGRAGAWREKGDFDRAIADANEGVRLDPKAAVAFNNRALFWRDMGDLNRALSDDNEAIRLEPKFDKPYSNRGEIWRLKGDLDRALEDQNQAIRLDTNNSTNYVLRGDTYRYKGELERALADYDQALVLEPDAIPAFTGRGLTFEKAGDFARSRTEFVKALASRSQSRSGINKSALETARARLAALDSGAPQPVIPAAPSKATSATSISTPKLTAVTSAPATVASSAGRRVALVIGNSAYKSVPRLTNPQNDAEAIAKSLRNIGFNAVTLTTDASREKMIDSLRVFANEAESADWAMVYYAGHGIEVGGVNYLIPTDAKLEVDRDIGYEAIPLSQVLSATNTAKKLKLVMLDACRDNPFTPRKTAAPEAIAASGSTAGAPIASRSSTGRGLAEVKVQGATLVVFAAKDGQVALDGDGSNSPFAVAVVQRIATPGVEINKMFRLVRDDVMEATAGRQEPYTYGSLPGREDLFFVAK
jgi:tetratricopeptide (TPR) repeat protein